MGVTDPLNRVLQSLRAAHTADPDLFRVRLGLGLVFVWLVVRLAFGPDPWTAGLAERAAEGHPPRPIDYVDTYGWWTAAAIAPLVLLLLATVRQWLRPDQTPTAPVWAAPRASRTFLWATAAAVGVGGVLAAPRLDQSLFEDERAVVRDIIDGAYYQDNDGNLRFIQKRWRDTLWWYKKPNNHVVQSMLSRASLSLHRALDEPRTRLVDERALRIPCLLAGLGSIAALAFLLKRLGYPVAGVIAAWTLALHPWHLRYATEARGYSVMLLLGTLYILALLAAVRRGSWRRWCVYGVLQFLLLLNYPLIGASVVLTNAAALVLLWRAYGAGAELSTQLTRWFMACLGGALLWAQLMTGNMAQLRLYLAREHAEVMDGLWFRDLGAYFLSGSAWGHARPNPNAWELSDFAAGAPALFGAIAAAGLVLLAGGALRLGRRSAEHATLAALLVLPGFATLALALASGTFIFPHYLIFGLPGAAALVALGVDGSLQRFGMRAATVAGIVFLVGFAAFTRPPRADLRDRAIQPFRDSVALTRKNPDPEAGSNKRIITVSFNWPPWYYDPNVKQVGDLNGLERWMERADAHDRPLYVNVGRPRIGLKRHPDIAAVVTDARLFEHVAYFPGLLSRGSRQVWRYRTQAERRRLRPRN